MSSPVRVLNVPAPIPEPLRRWHRAGNGRVLSVRHDGSVVLIELDFGGQRVARYESADAAIDAINANTIEWHEPAANDLRRASAFMH